MLFRQVISAVTLLSVSVVALAVESTPLGITQALSEVKLSLTVAGRVDAVLVREGSKVRKGDLLLHLDRSLEELEVRRRALMLADSAKLEELKKREKTQEDQVSDARKLLQSGGVSRKQVEDEQLTWQSTASERKALEFAKRREQVELDLAKEAFERRHLRSPIDGVVTKVIPHVGESVAQNEPVISVVDVSRVRFNGTFPAAGSSSLRVGDTVSIKIHQDNDTLIRQANLVFVSPVVDPSSGLVELIAEFDNLDGSVRPGMSGQIVVSNSASRSH
jgi:RND family efflux transporter MFP subunit